jgi:hypothetical protein
MRALPIIIICAFLFGCTSTKQPNRAASYPTITQQPVVAADAIDELVARINSYPFGTSGIYQKIDLLPTASPDEIVKIALENDAPNIGQVTTFKILTVRQVTLMQMVHPFTAVLVETNVGRKIVLFRYEGAAVQWWSHVYNAKTSA